MITHGAGHSASRRTALAAKQPVSDNRRQTTSLDRVRGPTTTRSDGADRWASRHQDGTQKRHHLSKFDDVVRSQDNRQGAATKHHPLISWVAPAKVVNTDT
ncbi:hypothetical protein LSH36_16g04018 [Paralvinella palmiformis]|uniref:Uncharacterized protein n=1 Tax=Paralvinella palmiformis TaxID=53620 RepID=A0AAD9KDI9_9ANNE|nr:hypothetical protein LSH36_16g04018 [Paralvinella palmiformis]